VWEFLIGTLYEKGGRVVNQPIVMTAQLKKARRIAVQNTRSAGAMVSVLEVGTLGTDPA